MARRVNPKMRADARREKETVSHEAGETRAYEKAEKEDKSLHKVVKKAIKVMKGKKK